MPLSNHHIGKTQSLAMAAMLTGIMQGVGNRGTDTPPVKSSPNQAKRKQQRHQRRSGQRASRSK